MPDEEYLSKGQSLEVDAKIVKSLEQIKSEHTALHTTVEVQTEKIGLMWKIIWGQTAIILFGIGKAVLGVVLK